MFKIEPMDQLKEESQEPVILVNVFHVAPDQADEFVAAWSDIIREFKSLPGFISAQFHRGTAGSGTFMNYAVWESVAHYRAAFTNPDFQGQILGYPDGTVATPHLFRKEAISNVCVS